MNLYADIKKITQIPQTDENPLFIRRKDFNVFKRNRKLKKPKPPRNVNLYDYDDNDSSSQTYNVSENCFLHENEIASSIKQANCGINYSNENFEEHWKVRQMEASLNSDDKAFKKNVASDIEISNGISIVKSDTDEKKSIEEQEMILKKCKLNKNAVIRGLLKNHTISLKDLHVPNGCKDIKDKSNGNIQNENVSSPSSSNEENSMKLVCCPEDPEILVQPLQAHGHIDESKYKNIDFSVPHIGKKKVTTPRQFFIDMDDSDFDFVKKDQKDKIKKFK